MALDFCPRERHDRDCLEHLRNVFVTSDLAEGERVERRDLDAVRHGGGAHARTRGELATNTVPVRAVRVPRGWN